MTWRVHSPRRSVWNVESTRGGREWTGAPSQPAALNLACSLAAIDSMLGRIHQPKPAIARIPGPRPARQYGCYPMRPKGR